MRAPKPKIEDVLAVSAAVAIVGFAFADFLFLHRMLYVRDVTRFFYPNFCALREIIRSGAIPFWSTRFNGGQPFAANPAYASLYPLQWIAALFPGTLGYRLEIVGHYLLAAIGMYVLLRSMRLRPLPALFGATSFVIGGTLLSLSNLINVLFGVAWFPWLAWATLRCFETWRRSDFARAALILGAILLTGDPAVILQAGFLVAALAVRARDRRTIVFTLAIVIAALAVGSAQIVPALDHQRDSGRATALPYSTAAQWSLPVVRPMELALPSLFGAFGDFTFYWAANRFYPGFGVPWVFSFYSGLLVFVLACAGFVSRSRDWFFAATLAIISYAFAVWPLLYHLGVRSIRYPEKFFVLGVFVLVVFAAETSDLLIDDDKLRRAAMIVALIVAIAAGSLLVWMTPERFARTWGLSGFFGDLLAQARNGATVTIATAIALTAILAARRFVSTPTWIALLALFVLADLGPRVRGLTPRIDASYFDPPPAAVPLRGARLYNDAAWRLALVPTPPIPIEQRRWRVRNAILPETQAIWEIDGVLEIDVTLTNLRPSIEFSRVFWTAQLGRRSDLVPLLLRMAGTTHVAELRDATAANDPIRIVALPGNDRYYFADSVVATPTMQEFFSRPRWSGNVAFVDAAPFAPAVARIVRAVERPNAIDLDVDAAGEALLVIAVTRHKYWTATADGAPVELHPANFAFQAIRVPSGRHRVALRYRNPLVVIFGGLSAVSAAALIGLAAAVGPHSREPQQPSPH